MRWRKGQRSTRVVGKVDSVRILEFNTRSNCYIEALIPLLSIEHFLEVESSGIYYTRDSPEICTVQGNKLLVYPTPKKNCTITIRQLIYKEK